MLIVVDANVICSGMLSKGKTIDLLFSDKIDPIAPELIFTEFEKHRKEIVNKSKLSEEEFDTVFTLLKKRIRVIPSNEFKDKLTEANRLLSLHTKDIEYVALALKFKCPLWSKEKLLKKLKVVEVLDADEVEKKFCL